MNQYIAIEAGGTKFVCAYGTDPQNLQERTTIPTETPEITLPQVMDYIKSVQRKVSIQGIGLACFGPLDLNPQSSTFGFITATTKLPWKFFNICDFFSSLNLPLGFDTDVNSSALGEYRWGAGKNVSDLLYLTIGTGIGGGVICNHQLVHGTMHPEVGHILIPKMLEDDSFNGVCAYHKNCFEGLASGPAMKVRWQVNSALDLPPNHVAWDLEANYIGIALANFTMAFSPKKIILGGGVMRQKHLLSKIRIKTLDCLKEYVQNPALDDIENYIVPPELGEDSGISGALILAENAKKNVSKNEYQ